MAGFAKKVGGFGLFCLLVCTRILSFLFPRELFYELSHCTFVFIL